MNHCATCKHWTTPEHDTGDWWSGSTSGVEFPHGRGECTRITMIGDSARPVPKADLAHVEDGSGYRAGLYTKPEFGCVLHEPR